MEGPESSCPLIFFLLVATPLAVMLQLMLSPTSLLVDAIHHTPVGDEDSLTHTFTFKAMATFHNLGLINLGLLFKFVLEGV